MTVFVKYCFNFHDFLLQRAKNKLFIKNVFLLPRVVYYIKGMIQCYFFHFQQRSEHVTASKCILSETVHAVQTFHFLLNVIKTLFHCFFYSIFYAFDLQSLLNNGI